MKKIIIIILIIGAAFLFYVRRNETEEALVAKPAAPPVNQEAAFRPDPSNATFIVEGEQIALSGGRNEKKITPESALVEETVILDKFAYGDVNADGKEDTALLLARFGGGSGTFIYLAAFISGPVTYRGSEAIFIGDRVVPQSISVSGNTVTVKYLDRAPGEAFAAEPTVVTSKVFIYSDGTFQEK
jgi:hypothetical protein